MGSRIHKTLKPNYKELERTEDVKINEKIEILGNMYPKKKFSELLDHVREVTIERIIENM